MAEIVNLRQARKKKRRDAKQRAAADNRQSHGRSTAEKKHVKLSSALDERRLEGHRLPPHEDEQGR